MVPPASDRVSRARPYSGAGSPRGSALRLRGCYPLRPAFPCRFGCMSLCDWACRARACRCAVPRPPCGNASPLTRAWVWAGALSLAATRAISVDFSSSGYLDVSVPRVVPRRPMGSGGRGRVWALPGCPIRRPRDRGMLAPPPGLSQLAASFVDFLCQGIRRAPLPSSQAPCPRDGQGACRGALAGPRPIVMRSRRNCPFRYEPPHIKGMGSPVSLYWLTIDIDDTYLIFHVR